MEIDNITKITRAVTPHGPITLEKGAWAAIEEKATESGLTAEDLLRDWLKNHSRIQKTRETSSTRGLTKKRGKPQPDPGNLESLIYSRLAKEMRPSALDRQTKNISTLERALDSVHPL